MANSQLAQHIADNQQLAAQTQQALRSNRRVIRHPVPSSNLTSEPVPPAASASPSVVKAKSTPTMVADTLPPFDDTIDEAVPIQPPTLSPPSRTPPALVKPKRSSNVVTLPNASITVSPLDLPTELFSAGLDRRKQNRHLLMQWLSSSLVDTIDYGRIHVVAKDRCQLTRIGKMADCMEPSHWSKPCLFKPGAEKISSALGVTVHYPSLRDYESAVLAKAEIHMIVLRCELRDAHGNVVAEGIGARDLKQDWGDVNKALKMCAKSAHIDAVLRLAGISSMFTQDIEDRPPAPDNGDASFVDDGAAFPDFNPGKSQAQAQTQARSPGRPPATDGRSTGTASKAKRQAPTPSPTSSTPATAQRGDGNELVSRADLVVLRQAIVTSGFTEKRVVAWLVKSTQGEVTTLEQLRKPQYASLLSRLDQWAEAEYFQQQPSDSTSTTRP